MDKEKCGIHHNKILVNYKERLNHEICTKMDKLGGKKTILSGETWNDKCCLFSLICGSLAPFSVFVLCV